MSENKKENKKDTVKEKEAEIVTIHDFKSMLIGMDLILGDDWTPDESQWKRIRKKIDALIETHERPGGVARPVPPFVAGSRPLPVDSTLNVNEAALLQSFPSVPVADDVPVGEGAPVGPSALTPAPIQRQPVMPSDGGAVKTPDIDSSGGYKSGYV